MKTDFGFYSFNKDVSSQQAKFNKIPYLRFVTFKEQADFESATFNKEAYFLFATFNEEVSFSNATFNEKVSFWSASFLKTAIFHPATFNEDTTFGCVSFNQGADFNSATFNEEVSFSNATFNTEADFSSTIFNKDGDFSFITFNEKANFWNVTFNEKAFFTSITFNDEGDFSSATFKKNVSFENLKKTNDGILTLNINRSQIIDNGCLIIDYKEDQNPLLKLIFNNYKEHKINPPMLLQLEDIECDGDAVRVKIRNLSPESNAKIEFKDCHFYGKNVAFTNVAMKHISIEGGNTVKGMLFDHCDFSTTHPTEWGLSKLQFRSLANESQWLNSQDKEKIKERALVYASLKTTATQAGETQLANDFHFWQQYYQGKLKSSHWNTIYKYTSAYGLSVSLPLCWIVFILSGFTLLYCLGFNFCFSNAFCISLFSSVPFFGGKDTIIHLYDKAYHDTLNEWFWFCFGFQSLLQSFLAFQFGAAIRNKVKR